MGRYVGEGWQRGRRKVPHGKSRRELDEEVQRIGCAHSCHGDDRELRVLVCRWRDCLRHFRGDELRLP